MAKKDKKSKADFNKKSKKKTAPKKEPYTGGMHWCGTMDRARRSWGRRNGF